MVSHDLLDILRCPVCVHNEPEGGELDVRENWLICQDCDRKYPIRDDIPVMLIEEGDRFSDVPVEELPDIPPPELPQPAPAAPPASVAQSGPMVPYAYLGAAAVLVAVLLVIVIRWLIGR